MESSEFKDVLRERIEGLVRSRLSEVEAAVSAAQSEVGDLLGKLARSVSPSSVDYAENPTLDQLSREIHAQVGQAAAESSRLSGDLALLRDSVVDVDSQQTQADVLNVLVDRAASFAPRVILFVVKGQDAIAWAARGFEDEIGDGAVRGLSVALASETMLSSVIKNESTYLGVPQDQSDNAVLLDRLGSVMPERIAGIPLRVRTKIAAVLYADTYDTSVSSISIEALELLVHSAGIIVELASLRQRLAEVAPAYAGVQPIVQSAPLPPPSYVNPYATLSTPRAEIAPAVTTAAAVTAETAAVATPAAEDEPESAEPAAAEPAPSASEVAEEPAVSTEETKERITADLEPPEPEPAAENVVAEPESEAPVAEAQAVSEPPAEVEPDLADTAETPIVETGFEFTAPPAAEQEPEEPAVSEPPSTGDEPEPSASAATDEPAPFSVAPSEPEAPAPFSFEPAPWQAAPVVELSPEPAAEPAVEATETSPPEPRASEPAPFVFTEAVAETSEPAPFVFTEPAEIVGDASAAGAEEAEPDERRMDRSAAEPFGWTESGVDERQPALTSETRAKPPFPGELGEEEEKLHSDARRFARLLVSEIKLYNEHQVVEGRSNNDLYERLRDDIDRSRQMYEKRVAAVVAERFDYFYDELLNTLALGDADKLGVQCPGPTV